MLDKLKLLIHNRRLLLFGPSIIILLFNLTYFNKYFPLMEGWWETYGYLVNRGYIPYKDINLALSPIFVLINAVLLKIVGDNFFLLRLIGVILCSLNVFLLQFFLEKYFDRKIATVSTLLASFLVISNSAFIAKDYHTYLDLFIIISFITAYSIIRMINPLKRNCEEKAKLGFAMHIFLFGLGGIVGILTLMKQNIGIFLFVAFGLCILTITCAYLKNFLKLLSYFTGYFTLILLFGLCCLFKDINVGLVGKIFFKSDYKGNLTVVLTRFILDPYNRKILAISLLLFLIYLLIIYMPKIEKNILIKYVNDYGYKYKEIANHFFLILIIVLSCICYILAGRYFFSAIIPFCLAVLWNLLLRVHFMRKNEREYFNYRIILIPLVALTYCNTHTAGFNFSGMYFVIAFCSAYLLSRLISLSYIKGKYLYLIMIIIVPLIVINKYKMPYSWWGFNQSNVFNARKELGYMQTKNIYVDSGTEEAFRIISEEIKKHSMSESDVYLFPNIPIFYYLHNKIPPFKNLIQWFDVISSEEIEDELREFKAKPPKIIIFLDAPDFVYQGHAELLKRKIVQTNFRNEFEKLVDQGKYELKKYYILDQRLIDLYYLKSIVERKVIVKNEKFNLKSLDYLFRETDGIGKFSIKGLIKDGTYMENIGSDIIISRNDILIIRIGDIYIKEIIEKIGYIMEGENYSIKIYTRKMNNID